MFYVAQSKLRPIFINFDTKSHRMCLVGCNLHGLIVWSHKRLLTLIHICLLSIFLDRFAKCDYLMFVYMVERINGEWMDKTRVSTHKLRSFGGGRKFRRFSSALNYDLRLKLVSCILRFLIYYKSKYNLLDEQIFQRTSDTILSSLL